MIPNTLEAIDKPKNVDEVLHATLATLMQSVRYADDETRLRILFCFLRDVLGVVQHLFGCIYE